MNHNINNILNMSLASHILVNQIYYYQSLAVIVSKIFYDHLVVSKFYKKYIVYQKIPKNYLMIKIREL